MTITKSQHLPSELAISDRDQRILGTILGSDQALAGRELVDVRLVPDQHVAIEKVNEYVELEKEAIRLINRDPTRTKAALAIINGIINEEPRYASAYNNRAQIVRLAAPDQAAPAGVISDLETAIRLASPRSATAQISKMQASVLRNAHCQLAAVYLAESKLVENWDRAWDLHVKASEMLIEASVYGEQIGAALAQTVNPYAKLSGNMLEEMVGGTTISKS